jgi:AcrR family transcriptional regulator
MRKPEVKNRRNISQRQNGDLRRKQIVRALRKIMIRYGSENVTVKKLAEEIGLSGGALYRHFKSKKEILLLLIEDIQEHLERDIGQVFPAPNPLDRLRNIARGLLSSAEQKKGVIFLVIAEIISLGDKELNRRISEVLNGFLAHIERLLSEGIGAGEIREDMDVDMAAMTFFGMLQGLVTIWSLRGFPSRLKINNEAMWNFYHAGIKKERIKSVPKLEARYLPLSARIEASKVL